MKTKQVNLIQGAENIRLKKSTEECTEIYFTTPKWHSKTCIHVVSGMWEIESINQEIVTLVNHDETIPAKPE